MVRTLPTLVAIAFATVVSTPQLSAHGTVVSPASRTYRVFQSDPNNPNFALAQGAVAIDGAQSYFNWHEQLRKIPQAVQAGLPPGFDYSPWISDGQIAGAGCVDPNTNEYPNTYAGLDQVSADWPTTPAVAGASLSVDFFAQATHTGTVWDVWMTTPDWDPATALNWAQMEFLERPNPTLSGSSYLFDLTIPADRSGHHVLWVVWQRDIAGGQVFFSSCDLMIEPAGGPGTNYCFGDGTGAACPCGTNGNPGEGCMNTSGAGATLSASGNASIGGDTFQLDISGVPGNKPGLILRGANQLAGNPAGDGLLCTSGQTARSHVQVTSAGNTTFTDFQGNPFGSSSYGIGVPTNYQFWYRDPGNPCSGAGFNFSNACAVTWQP
jgi:predicted carbohydrate-binding protein with CBM5 and CBM33 domain